MLLCPKCGRKMNNVMHFDSNSSYQYKRCPFCFYESKNKRLYLNTLYNDTDKNLNKENKGNKNEKIVIRNKQR